MLERWKWHFRASRFQEFLRPLNYHSRLLFQSRPPTSKHFETPVCHPLVQRTQLIFFIIFFIHYCYLVGSHLLVAMYPRNTLLNSFRVEQKEATPVLDRGTLVIGMRGLRPYGVLLVSVSSLVLLSPSQFIKASVVLWIMSSTYLLFIIWQWAKRIYIFIIKVSKLFSYFSLQCFLKEIGSNLFSMFLSSYREHWWKFGRTQKRCGNMQLMFPQHLLFSQTSTPVS